MQTTYTTPYQEVINAIKWLVHDIRSPLTSLLSHIECSNYSKEEQDFMTNRLQRIDGILNTSIQKYTDNKQKHIDQDEPVAIAKLISDVIAEKRAEYQNKHIKFSHSYMNDGELASIRISPSDFQTMLSNLINNSVEACHGRNGMIDIAVSKNSNRVRIMIADNGRGMPGDVVDKIRNNIAVTYGKENGQGFGFIQVRETLANSGGRFFITSAQNSTIITLTFLDAEKSITRNPHQPIDLVLVDNDDMTADLVTNYILKGKSVYVYETAEEFLNEVRLYPLDTKMLISYKFRDETIDGIEIVNQLHKLGYTNCYLNADWPFDEGQLPSHIKRMDINGL